MASRLRTLGTDDVPAPVVVDVEQLQRWDFSFLLFYISNY